MAEKWMQIIEPVFANMRYCKGMDRFTYRGQVKVNTQWQLYIIVHNIWKCMKPLGKKYEAQGKNKGDNPFIIADPRINQQKYF